MEEYRRMQTDWEALLRDAQLRASDLADELWHLWFASEGHEGAAQGGSAAAGRREKSSVHLGTRGFIVDTGCGHNLIAERCIRAAGAMGMIKIRRFDYPEYCWRFLSGPRFSLRRMPQLQGWEF
eukprot:2976585-Pyramimonas_sp.AAC.1